MRRMPVQNSDVARISARLDDLLELEGKNQFEVKAEARERDVPVMDRKGFAGFLRDRGVDPARGG
jgi:hypothetical protein